MQGVGSTMVGLSRVKDSCGEADRGMREFRMRHHVPIRATRPGKRLAEIFKFVSDPFLMRNSTGGIMYHFMMASNNKSAQKIANDIIKPKYK